MTVRASTGPTDRPAKPRTWPRTVAALLLLALITWWAQLGVHVDLGAIAGNMHNAVGNVIQLFQPDYTFWPHTVGPLLETLSMAVIATAAGALIAAPLSFLASSATNPQRWLVRLVRFCLNVIRAVPDILWAALMVAVVGVGALPGMLALTLFNVGILAKLISESLDSEYRGGQEAALAAGATWFAADRIAMVPQVLPAYASQTLYTFEINIRASSVIGLVGAGGLGVLIDNVRTYYLYHDLALVILEIFVMIVILEQLSGWVRKRLVG